MGVDVDGRELESIMARGGKGASSEIHLWAFQPAETRLGSSFRLPMFRHPLTIRLLLTHPIIRHPFDAFYARYRSVADVIAVMEAEEATSSDTGDSVWFNSSSLLFGS